MIQEYAYKRDSKEFDKYHKYEEDSRPQPKNFFDVTFSYITMLERVPYYHAHHFGC